MIAIISDIHDNIANLETFLNWARAKAVKNIICCGDITNSETLERLARGFEGTIDIVRGNVEIFSHDDAKGHRNIRDHGKVARINVDGRYIGACHEPYLFDKVLELGRPEIVFYGHTHKPWEETKNSVRFVNPGTLGGVFQRATFASYDPASQDLQLHILDQL